MKLKFRANCIEIPLEINLVGERVLFFSSLFFSLWAANDWTVGGFFSFFFPFLRYILIMVIGEGSSRFSIHLIRPREILIDGGKEEVSSERSTGGQRRRANGLKSARWKMLLRARKRTGSPLFPISRRRWYFRVPTILELLACGFRVICRLCELSNAIHSVFFFLSFFLFFSCFFFFFFYSDRHYLKKRNKKRSKT